MKSGYTIGVDARGLFSLHPRGHVKAFLNTYSKLAALRPDWRVWLFSVPPSTDEPRLPVLPNLKPVFLDPKGGRWFGYQRLWRDVWLPASLLRRHVDVFHGPCGPMPRLLHCPAVITIHDLLPLRNAHGSTWEHQYRWTRGVIDRARLVLTPSQFTAEEIVGMCGAHVREKIRVIHWAASEECDAPVSAEQLRAVREKYDLPQHYVLIFGSENRAHKNVDRMLSAYAKVSAQHDGAVPALCIAGVSSGPALAEYRRRVDELGISAKVRFLGYVLDPEIPALLNMADCLMFVSLYEGFGLPPLDAFACGCPVIASDVASIPEVVGSAAMLVDPHDEEEIAGALSRLLSDGELARTLVARGRDRLSSFSWRRTAEVMAGVLEEAAAKPRDDA